MSPTENNGADMPGMAPLPASPTMPQAAMPAIAPVPEIPEAPAAAAAGSSQDPMPVVRVLSVRGVEYGMMTIALWVVATTLAWIALNLINGSKGFSYVVVPTSALVVSVPILGLLFLRLKKAELANPSLKFDPSKRRWSQITQFLAFIACFINVIYLVYAILDHISGGSAPSIGKTLISTLVVLVIAGGVLAYYWRDEHRGV